MSDVLISCCNCGIRFSVPQAWYRHRQEMGQKLTWYCPNGHSQVFTESTVDIARRERDRAIQQKARLEQELAAQKALTAAAEAREKRAKKRTVAGVCPCCPRSFVNLSRHIATKHPEYRKESLNA